MGQCTKVTLYAFIKSWVTKNTEVNSQDCSNYCYVIVLKRNTEIGSYFMNQLGVISTEQSINI